MMPDGAVVAESCAAPLNVALTRYHHDTLGLPGWGERVAGRLTEEDFGAAQLMSIQRAVGPFAGRRVLNVGCGTGGFNVAAEARVGELNVGVGEPAEGTLLRAYYRELRVNPCIAPAARKPAP